MLVKSPIRPAFVLALACVIVAAANCPVHGAPTEDDTLSAAVCSIVYPVDQFATDRGIHYLFYGNGFFINEQGYLLTAAHVLSQLHGGQPFVLVRTTTGLPKILQATLIAADREHDIAILRATPNPFGGGYQVAYLPLSEEWVTHGSAVLSAAVLPSKPLDAYTLDPAISERTSGEVFAFPFSQLDKGRNQTELFLFNHEVRRGQSGSPVVSPESKAVVGLIEGQWLRSSLISLTTASDQAAPGTGAAVPTHYAIALLQQKGVAWHTASGAVGPTDLVASQAGGFVPPSPVSLVASPFPSQALFGGEVVIDALIDIHGRVSAVKVVSGESPFLENVFGTIRTWTFAPAHQDGQAMAGRIGIVFQFVQSYEPARKPASRKYIEPFAHAAERSALPVATIEPQAAPPTSEDGSVILQADIARDGHLSSVRVLRDTEGLSAPAEATLKQWSFYPGKREAAASDSAAIIVMIFRHAGSTLDSSRND